VDEAKITFPYQEIELALQHGKYALQGEFLYGSNRTFLCTVTYKEQTSNCVYKPDRGERPLWDFETGSLARREVAAYLIDSVLGWHAVPPCVLREDGPFGPGSLHWFVAHDPNQHYFTFTDELKASLQFVPLFDSLINNADRKAGHFLLDEANKVWLIDHGLCFHSEEKLRTVAWDFAGQEIPRHLLLDLQHLHDAWLGSELHERLLRLISVDEFEALLARLDALLALSHFPHPSEERRMFPWPLV
jgi:hypothetical protein